MTLYYVAVHFFSIFLIIMQLEDRRDPEIMGALVYAPMQVLMAIGLFVILQKRELKRFLQQREAERKEVEAVKKKE